MNSFKILYVVHCVDTEGPLEETIGATFDRLKAMYGFSLEPTTQNLEKIQNCEIDFQGNEQSIAKCFSKELLAYNKNWTEIESMLSEILSPEFRNLMLDDFDNGWVYSWHCMDHIGYIENPRHKDVGYGNIFRFYRDILYKSNSIKDEINWHFHPVSLTQNSIHAATSYLNSYNVLLQILCRRILDDNWFPVVNRPGFHAERPDSNLFLEQWVPFDYANQSCLEAQDQPDSLFGRFGDWTRSSKSWRGYHPSHDDYQISGLCKRIIFRCLNVGTRLRCLTENDVRDAFDEADLNGGAILAFANHDYRDMRPDIKFVREMLSRVKKNYPNVKIKFAGAEEAAKLLNGFSQIENPALEIQIKKNRLLVKLIKGEIFGPQPFLAIKSKGGQYYHDNLDVILPGKEWSYVLDSQTLEVANIAKIGVGTAGRYGGKCACSINL